MSKAKRTSFDVKGTAITVVAKDGVDYISLTDMLRAKDGDFFISDWLRNRNTIEFLGIWESVFNPRFNYGEFALIKSQAGLNSYKISVKEWVEKTQAIGLQASTGRYGGTYAHPDIAFEFGMWISPEFKVYLVKEFRRLKADENDRLKLDWNLQRTLSKINYRIHTDAIRDTLIPPAITKAQASFVYAEEADLLNVALFGQTAKQWRDAHPDAEGIRDQIQRIVPRLRRTISYARCRTERQTNHRAAALPERSATYCHRPRSLPFRRAAHPVGSPRRDGVG